MEQVTGFMIGYFEVQGLDGFFKINHDEEFGNVFDFIIELVGAFDIIFVIPQQMPVLFEEGPAPRRINDDIIHSGLFKGINIAFCQNTGGVQIAVMPVERTTASLVWGSMNFTMIAIEDFHGIPIDIRESHIHDAPGDETHLIFDSAGGSPFLRNGGIGKGEFHLGTELFEFRQVRRDKIENFGGAGKPLQTGLFIKPETVSQEF